MRQECRKLSSGNPLAKAMNYSLERWAALTRFLDAGRACMSNNAAKRVLRGIAVGRRNLDVHRDPILGAGARRPSTPSLRPPSSTTSTARLDGRPPRPHHRPLGQPHCRAAALELGGCEAASDGSLIARDNPCGVTGRLLAATASPTSSGHDPIHAAQAGAALKNQGNFRIRL